VSNQRTNVLSEALFTHAGQCRSLPELLAGLLCDLPSDAPSFPNVAPEQWSYWYRFLVRCGACVAESLTLDLAYPLAQDAALNRRIRSALADAAGGEAAWDLCNPDVGDAAFLQAPASAGGTVESARFRSESVSLLTTVLGGKNHERKSDAVRSFSPERAVYALVAYQSGVIYGGRGNYESQLTGSRSGAGSGTPFMGVRMDGNPSATFRHDVAAFVGDFGRIRSELKIAGVIWALWTVPWDGKREILSTSLHPAFIPLARQVRLEPSESDRLTRVWFRPSGASRVRDVSGGGNYGDPFTPMITNSQGQYKIRGTLRTGYDYREVVALILGDDSHEPSPAVAALRRASVGSGDARILFEGTAYEQGKTNGFFRREVLIPFRPHGSPVFTRPPDVADVHHIMLRKVVDAGRALRGAVRVLMHGEPKPRTGDDAAAHLPVAFLEERLDEIYVDRLLANGDRHLSGDEGWEGDWSESLRRLSLKAFNTVEPAVPTSSATRFERRADAHRYLDRKLRDISPQATEDA
jgi:CRISPR-associated protein Cse1 (CRISPR_cse1)